MSIDGVNPDVFDRVGERLEGHGVEIDECITDEELALLGDFYFASEGHKIRRQVEKVNRQNAAVNRQNAKQFLLPAEFAVEPDAINLLTFRRSSEGEQNNGDSN